MSRGQGKGFTSVRRCNPAIAKFGLLLIGLALLLDGVALAVDIVASSRIVRGVPLEDIGLEFRSDLSRAANLALPVALLIGAPLFLMWFYCAYKRLHEATDGALTRFTPSWSLLGWVVPGINLIRPPQIMADLTGDSFRIRPWWLLWIFGALVQVGLRVVTPGDQTGWLVWQAVALAGDLILLISLDNGRVLVSQATAGPSRI